MTDFEDIAFKIFDRTDTSFPKPVVARNFGNTPLTLDQKQHYKGALTSLELLDQYYIQYSNWFKTQGVIVPFVMPKAANGAPIQLDTSVKIKIFESVSPKAIAMFGSLLYNSLRYTAANKLPVSPVPLSYPVAELPPPDRKDTVPPELKHIQEARIVQSVAADYNQHVVECAHVAGTVFHLDQNRAVVVLGDVGGVVTQALAQARVNSVRSFTDQPLSIVVAERNHINTMEIGIEKGLKLLKPGVVCYAYKMLHVIPDIVDRVLSTGAYIIVHDTNDVYASMNRLLPVGLSDSMAIATNFPYTRRFEQVLPEYGKARIVVPKNIPHSIASMYNGFVMHGPLADEQIDVIERVNSNNDHRYVSVDCSKNDPLQYAQVRDDPHRMWLHIISDTCTCQFEPELVKGVWDLRFNTLLSHKSMAHVCDITRSASADEFSKVFPEFAMLHMPLFAQRRNVTVNKLVTIVANRWYFTRPGRFAWLYEDSSKKKMLQNQVHGKCLGNSGLWLLMFKTAGFASYGVVTDPDDEYHDTGNQCFFVSMGFVNVWEHTPGAYKDVLKRFEVPKLFNIGWLQRRITEFSDEIDLTRRLVEWYVVQQRMRKLDHKWVWYIDGIDDYSVCGAVLNAPIEVIMMMINGDETIGKWLAIGMSRFRQLGPR